MSEASNHTKKNIRSVDANARRVMSWRREILIIYSRWRVMGSSESLLWLASRVRGNSQQVSRIRGPEMLSTRKNESW